MASVTAVSTEVEPSFPRKREPSQPHYRQPKTPAFAGVTGVSGFPRYPSGRSRSPFAAFAGDAMASYIDNP
jgi:hypothetical protein